jgi:hypothetical protein
MSTTVVPAGTSKLLVKPYDIRLDLTDSRQLHQPNEYNEYSIWTHTKYLLLYRRTIRYYLRGPSFLHNRLAPRLPREGYGPW